MVSEGLKSAGIMTVGSISASILSAIAMIIFSRILGPSDFGIFSVLFSLLLILSKIGDAGINVAVQREVARRKGDEGKDILTIQAGSALKVALFVGIAAVGLVAGPWIGVHWLNIGEHAYLVRWICLLSGGVIFYEYINVILQAKQYFGWSVFSNFVQSTFKLVCAISLMYIGLNLGVITLVYVLIPILGGVVAFAKIPVQYFVPTWDKKQVQRIISVARWTGIAILSATIADNVDVILVQNFLSSYDTGIWSAAVRISMLYSLVGWSLGTVLNVRVAKYHDIKNLRAYLKKAHIIALGSLIGLSALILLSDPLIRITVGPEYLEAVGALNLLAISNALTIAAIPYIALFYLFDKPQYYAYAGILQTVVLIVGDYLLIPIMGIMGAGWVRIGVRLIVLVFTLFYVRHAYTEKYGRR